METTDLLTALILIGDLPDSAIATAPMAYAPRDLDLSQEEET